MENENIVYGRLTESVHISGYSLERAIGEFEWLLEEERWKKVGTGYDDINEFLKTLSFKEFKIAIDQRKKIAEKLVELQASQRATAKVLGVNNATISRDVANATLEEKIITDNKEVINESVANATEEEIPGWIEDSGQKESKQKIQKEEKIKERQKQIQETKERIAFENTVISDKYDVIVIDPPWAYEERGGFNNKQHDPDSNRGGVDYPTMTLAQIAEIKMPLKENAVVFLWTTHAFIHDSFHLLDRWGLQYKAIMIWDKEKMGMGRTIRLQCEFCLLAIFGKPLIEGSSERDIIRESRREHSRKPEAFYLMVERMTTGKRLDYFSRSNRKNWDCYGAEAERF